MRLWSGQYGGGVGPTELHGSSMTATRLRAPRCDVRPDPPATRRYRSAVGHWGALAGRVGTRADRSASRALLEKAATGGARAGATVGAQRTRAPSGEAALPSRARYRREAALNAAIRADRTCLAERTATGGRVGNARAHGLRIAASASETRLSVRSAALAARTTACAALLGCGAGGAGACATRALAPARKARAALGGRGALLLRLVAAGTGRAAGTAATLGPRRTGPRCVDARDAHSAFAAAGAAVLCVEARRAVELARDTLLLVAGEFQRLAAARRCRAALRLGAARATRPVRAAFAATLRVRLTARASGGARSDRVRTRIGGLPARTAATATASTATAAAAVSASARVASVTAAARARVRIAAAAPDTAAPGGAATVAPAAAPACATGAPSTAAASAPRACAAASSATLAAGCAGVFPASGAAGVLGRTREVDQRQAQDGSRATTHPPASRHSSTPFARRRRLPAPFREDTTAPLGASALASRGARTDCVVSPARDCARGILSPRGERSPAALGRSGSCPDRCSARNRFRAASSCSRRWRSG